MTTQSELHIVFGPQGAGKTTLARQLSVSTDGLYFSIDDWMGRLFLPDLPEELDFGWVGERVQRCEGQIWSVAQQVLRSGKAVVLDLGLLQRQDRQRYVALAQVDGRSVTFHFVHAAPEVRRSRVLARNAQQDGSSPFEVTPVMFEFMEGRYQAPDAQELAQNVVVYET